MPQVIIFVLHGAAMAGGLGMASAADIVIAVKDTKMALTETAIGIVPAQIGRYIVARTGDVKGAAYYADRPSFYRAGRCGLWAG